MCGIAGFLRLGASTAEEMRLAVERMADAVRHRGPDDHGGWVDPNGGIALGHRRLSIVDLSPAGHQPMSSQEGRYVIAFNGEIYNHLELRAELRSTGASYDWRGHSDTESLLACVEAWGLERTLGRAVGMFAIALWDRQRNALTLVRDRMGEKPLYYGWQDGHFLFGSELRALKAHPAFRATVDAGALSLLLRHNVVPAPHSIYEGIYKLPPGTWLEVERSGELPKPVPYWSLAEVALQGTVNPFQGSEFEAVAQLEDRLDQAVRSQMVADVPLGALLSGGIDSSTIVAIMQKNSLRPVRTFTIGFDERGYDESGSARAIAQHLGTQHTELRLSGSDAQSVVPQLPDIYDEPFADSSQLPTHLVMKLAREHVTVALSGDGGDELFGGYNRYIHAPMVWSMMGRAPFAVRRLVGRGLQLLSAETINGLGGSVARLMGVSLPGEKAHKLGRKLSHVRSIDDLCVSMLTEWPDASEVVVNGRFPRNIVDDRANWPKIADPVARMMVVDGLFYLPDDILTKVDRAAMSVSLETRVPFLDRHVLEFASRIPMHMKIRGGTGKWILRTLLDKYIPHELTHRPKTGFSIPLDAWLRGPLREWASDLLTDDRLRREGYFSPEQITSLWRAHLAGRANGHRLWSVLMFQAWLQKNT